MAERDWAGRRFLRRQLFPDFDGNPQSLVKALTDPERREVAAVWLGELGEVRAAPEIARLRHCLFTAQGVVMAAVCECIA
jgi:hypothetical protein